MAGRGEVVGETKRASGRRVEHFSYGLPLLTKRTLVRPGGMVATYSISRWALLVDCMVVTMYLEAVMIFENMQTA